MRFGELGAGTFEVTRGRELLRLLEERSASGLVSGACGYGRRCCHEERGGKSEV
ncbi:Hypothetical protein A7982_11579 [Minicystis rosea]|nr:Hypothetical protein A7982_11579 [Minicystis rosea]